MIDPSDTKAEMMWLLSRLDRWDETQAALDDANKPFEKMALGASLAFPEADDGAPLSGLAGLVEQQSSAPQLFYASPPLAPQFNLEGDLLTFRSGVDTETEANNIVKARIYRAKRPRKAAVILPHWNAPMWAYQKFGQHLARLGLTVVELCLPYQGERNRPGAATSDYFLSANVGRTIRSVRQAVLDTRGLLNWLEQTGHESLGLIGVSLGSCIAGLVAAHDTRVTASALLLTAGDFAEVVWTGRATQHVKSGLAGGISLRELQQVWSIISTGRYVRQLARRSHRTLIISASRDRVVTPALTQRFVEELRGAGGRVSWRTLPCGHYSLALLPFSAVAFALLVRFLRTNSDA